MKEYDTFFLQIMNDLIYQVSDKLDNVINQAEILNREISSKNLPNEISQSLKFDALCRKICYDLVLRNVPMTRAEVASVLSSKISGIIRRKEGILDSDITISFDIYEDIYWKYYATNKPLTSSSVINYFGMLGEKKSGVKTQRRKIKRILSYQNSKQNPTVIAALIYILIYYDTLLGSKRSQLASIISWGYLSSKGFTGNNLIVIEEEWNRDYKQYKYALDTAIERENATIWIEYYLKSYIEACKNVIKRTTDYGLRTTIDGSQSTVDGGLTERQKGIVGLFITKTRQVTNRQVQRQFKISQLTASRDLSLLASKGLIVPHGKGRNTYYTRI